ncbi:LamG-like jellyroll fold domain-containing protein [Epilithonimonas mollis]|uniref:Concanavalin A-like lectin/glucanases superfamily protein n=1 Tax=Epilithonimonas mollis TaxID=216903 RepID=A0A1M6ULG2_9FLAO|nr:LamG-like jellyroll fold domain-containing protein [Epilithonimonas mollis]SHK69970.1 Concanavalin A-like lectin/glucanases superfamily protein [Epilithonimonas mollis]
MNALKLFFGEKPFSKGLKSYLGFNGNLSDSVIKLPTWISSGTVSFNPSDFNQSIICTSCSCTNTFQNMPDNYFDICTAISDIPFSITVRIKLSEFRSSSYLFCNYAYPNAQFRLIINNSGQIQFFRHSQLSDNVYLRIISSINLVLNNYYTITITGDGSKNGVKIYINGDNRTGAQNEVGTYARMSPLKAATLINDSALLTNRQFVGEMDFFAFWQNRELSDAEVKILYQRKCELL